MALLLLLLAWPAMAATAHLRWDLRPQRPLVSIELPGVADSKPVGAALQLAHPCGGYDMLPRSEFRCKQEAAWFWRQATIRLEALRPVLTELRVTELRVELLTPRGVARRYVTEFPPAFDLSHPLPGIQYAFGFTMPELLAVWRPFLFAYGLALVAFLVWRKIPVSQERLPWVQSVTTRHLAILGVAAATFWWADRSGFQSFADFCRDSQIYWNPIGWANAVAFAFFSMYEPAGRTPLIGFNWHLRQRLLLPVILIVGILGLDLGPLLWILFAFNSFANSMQLPFLVPRIRALPSYGPLAQRVKQMAEFGRPPLNAEAGVLDAAAEPLHPDWSRLVIPPAWIDRFPKRELDATLAFELWIRKKHRLLPGQATLFLVAYLGGQLAPVSIWIQPAVMLLLIAAARFAFGHVERRAEELAVFTTRDPEAHIGAMVRMYGAPEPGSALWKRLDGLAWRWWVPNETFHKLLENPPAAGDFYRAE